MQIFNYEQPTPALTWTIDHNLGCKTTFDVFVNDEGALVKIYPASVIHASDDQLVLTFSTPQTGKARIAGTPI